MTGYLTTGDSSNFYTTANESGFITGVDLTDYATTNYVDSSVSGKYDTSSFSAVSGNFLTGLPSDLVYTADLESVSAEITGMIPTALTGDYIETSAMKSAQLGTSAFITGFYDGQISAAFANEANKAISANHADSAATAGSAHSASYVFSGWGDTPTLYHTDSAIKQYYAVTGNIQGFPAGTLYKFNAYSADSAATAGSANHLNQGGTMGGDIRQDKGTSTFYYMPTKSPWTTLSGIYLPLQYATGACLTMAGGDYGAYFKGNEWYVSNSAIGQALRGEVHQSRGVHISGATTAGYGFNLGIANVSGVNSTGSWKYGHAEDAALRAVSSCDMHESAFGYDASDNITAYNGSAFKAGGDIPTGVMIESALEYNAVNEISGYNGSAFATEAHQKQWIIHDDTLLHEANSAQYALGVNVSAVAQLMSVDETVLWEGSMTWGQNGSLADSVKNYERIRFYIEETNRHRKSINEMVLTDLSNANLREFSLNLPDATTTYFGNYFTVYQINEAGTSITSVSGRQWWYNPWTSTAINGSTDRGLILKKVVGIGRKN